MGTKQVNMRLTAQDRARLERLADARGISRTEVVRHLLAEADDVPLPGPPDREELIRLLGEAARSGSVRACEVLLARRWERGAAEPPPKASQDDPFAEVDQLRARRELQRARR
jgi:hypothetical protein